MKARVRLALMLAATLLVGAVPVIQAALAMSHPATSTAAQKTAPAAAALLAAR